MEIRPETAGPGQTLSIGGSTSMSTATSVVGNWDGHVAWGCSGPAVSDASTQWTFKADGSWTYEFGGGRWAQVEGLVFWNFTNAAGLIYTANVTRNALDGIQGYAVAGGATGLSISQMSSLNGINKLTMRR